MPLGGRIWAALTLLSAIGCGGEVPKYAGEVGARDPAPLGSLVGKLLTSNVGDDTLSVLDARTPGPAARLPVGANPVELEGPHHLSADPAGRFVYLNLSMAVAGSGGGPHGFHGLGDTPGYVVKLDTATGKEVARVRVEPNPGDNTLAADGRTLYVTHYDEKRWRSDGADAQLLVLDVERMVITARRALCPAAHGVRLSADGQTLYSTCGPDELAVVDLRDPSLPLRRVPVPGGLVGGKACQRCPYALGVAPDGSVWVSSLGPGSAGRGSVDVFDPSREGGSFDPQRRIGFTGRPVFAEFVRGPGGATDYQAVVPEQQAPGDRLHLYRSAGPGAAPIGEAVIDLPPADCLNAHMALVAEGGQRAQLVCEGDHKGPGTLVWLDLAGRGVLGATTTGVFPDGIVLVPGVPAP
jgi:hypothetical protein